MGRTLQSNPKLDSLRTRVFTVPTDQPESDGTLKWDHTTMVLVEPGAGGTTGIGYTYANAAAAEVIHSMLAPKIHGMDPLDIGACWRTMCAAIRNNGRCGLAMMACAAVDNALWDLKARLLGLPLARLIGAVRAAAPVYGSGGFTSYDDARLRRQLGGWVELGIPRVKMKVGRDPADDPRRVRLARETIGKATGLFVDANGAYPLREALAMAETFHEVGRVNWFEEPIIHDDFAGLAWLRHRTPSPMEISIGEYGWESGYFRRALETGAVDILQADATRCGISGFIEAAALCAAHHIDLSAHCAPYLHRHLGCALAPVRHLEYFHDHVRIEQMFFDGAAPPVDGALVPDASAPGLGLVLKEADARRFEQSVREVA